MELTGKLQAVSIDLATNKLNVTIQANEEARFLADEIRPLSDCEKLSVVIKKWHKKRSLDANAYYWVLVSRIAEKLRISKDEVHDMMLGRYGQVEREEDGTAVILSVLEHIDMAKLEGIHVKPIGRGTVGGKKFTHYLLLRGSHTYDTKEMSVLIDGVVSEAREMGIETISDEDMERMLATWRGGR